MSSPGEARLSPDYSRSLKIQGAKIWSKPEQSGPIWSKPERNSSPHKSGLLPFQRAWIEDSVFPRPPPPFFHERQSAFISGSLPVAARILRSLRFLGVEPPGHSAIRVHPRPSVVSEFRGVPPSCESCPSCPFCRRKFRPNSSNFCHSFQSSQIKVNQTKSSQIKPEAPPSRRSNR